MLISSNPVFRQIGFALIQIMQIIGQTEDAPIEAVEEREATPQEIEIVVHLLFDWWRRNIEDTERASVEANLRIDNPDRERGPE